MVYVVAMMHRPGSVSELAEKAQMERKTVAKHCRELQRLGWMKIIDERGRQHPMPILPVEVETRLADEAKKELEVAAYKGEATAKKFLDWLTYPTIQYIDNARPSFLKNPETDQPMELDRFRPPDLAWEYNGEQHYGTTEKYPSEKAFRDTRKRDLMKEALCLENQVRLIIITKDDLTLERMLGKIPPELLRPADMTGPFIGMLDQAGRECARRRDWDRDED